MPLTTELAEEPLLLERLSPPKDRYARSRALNERALRVLPGGISSNVRKNWSPVPLFYTHGEGSRIWDADGNEYIDYVLARGPLLLGHSPRRVIDAVKRQMDVGLMYAGQNLLELEAAERICELVPCAEMVRFSSSGSEAVQGAWRLARGVTGKSKVVRFEGHYHGWFDSQIWSMAPPLEAAGPRESPNPVVTTAGVPAGEADDIIVLPWNDLDLLKKTLEARAGEIALVCMETIMCNNGTIPPAPGYLEGVRALCTRHGVLLMFDEVITGFRLSIGGAQKFFGVTPDIATFAKGVAAGFAVSVIAGKRDIMQHFGDLRVLHAGTYNSNPPCMAAVIASLDELTANDGIVYDTIFRRGQRLMEGIREAGRRAGKPVSVRGFPPVFNVSFGTEEPVTDYRSFVKRDVAMQRRYFELLQNQGVRTTPDQLYFVSAAHTDADIDQTLDVVNEVMELL